MKQSIVAYVNHARNRYLNQIVLCNEALIVLHNGAFDWARTNDWLNSSQTLNPVRHTAPVSMIATWYTLCDIAIYMLFNLLRL